MWTEKIIIFNESHDSSLAVQLQGRLHNAEYIIQILWSLLKLKNTATGPCLKLCLNSSIESLMPLTACSPFSPAIISIIIFKCYGLLLGLMLIFHCVFSVFRKKPQPNLNASIYLHR